MAGGAAGDEAAWRDLIANYAREPGPGDGDVPWPERENLSAPPTGPRPDPDTDPAMIDVSDDTDPALDLGDDFGPEPGPRGSLPGSGWWLGSGPLTGPWPGRGPLPGSAGFARPDGRPGAEAPPGGPPPWNAFGPSRPRSRPAPGTGASGPGQDGADPVRGGPGRDEPHDSDPARVVRPARPGPPAPADDGEDFIPPEPPPLPSLTPVAKGAWAALFGGPGYLLAATMAGWAVPGWAAFLAVAAFVAGFAVLVIQLGDRPPRDSGPDDGAVV